jgi:hypothetical protein
MTFSWRRIDNARGPWKIPIVLDLYFEVSPHSFLLLHLVLAEEI